jgi:predicted amidophosphoribosyltransferase
MTCRESPVIKSADFVFPILPYRLWAKNLLTAWKLGGHRELSPVFAKTLHIAIQNQDGMKDSVIVPVPPRPGKIKKNGWDQIDEICTFMHYKYRYRVFKLLERISRTQQKKLNREGRLSSMGSVYVLSELCKKMGSINQLPSSVILVDDVMTTGATVESCAFLLKECGISKINILTLFIVD